MMIILLIGICVFMYFIFFNGQTGKGHFTKLDKESAEDKLKMRFVNGEIDEKTYLQMKETLKG